MTSYIGTTNLIDGASITVTSEVTGFEKENAYSWNTFDYWRPTSIGVVYYTIDFGTSKSIDSWSVGFFDLAPNAGSIKPQYSNDNFATNIVDFDTWQSISSFDLIVRKKASISTRYFRFAIQSLIAPSNIGLLWAGVLIPLQRGLSTGFIDPKLARDKKIMNTKSEGGQPLGTSVIQNGYKFSISQINVTSAWIDSNWEAIVNHLESPNRFLFVWDLENRPTNSIFCWVDGKINYPRYNAPNHLDFTIPCKGLIS